MRAFSPLTYQDPLDPVTVEDTIVAHNHQILGKRLSNQHAVEGILVRPRQQSGPRQSCLANKIQFLSSRAKRGICSP